MSAYYNEFDETAAHVLRELIKINAIAPGDVDTRSIKDVQPDDLKSYAQCHFFAGGGLWSVAARLAGWPDDKPLWTGSCPCQPFSQAGQGRGTADERHLWPDFHRLIAARRPPIVVGEQVAGKAGYGWLDGVRADLGAEGYASGAVDIPAAAVDAPHIRQRLYWVGARASAVADSTQVGRQWNRGTWHGRDGFANSDGGPMVNTSGFGRGEGRPQPELRNGRPTTASADAPEQHVVHPFNAGLEGHAGHGYGAPGWPDPHRPIAETDGSDLGNTASDGWQQGQVATEATRYGHQPAATHGSNGTFWADHEWLTCHDGKARRTKPGLRLLAHGYAGRVAAWRIAGNAIVAPLAAEVLKALMDVTPVTHAGEIDG